MSIENAPAGAVSPRADLVSALLWVAFGGAVAIGGWRMDRLAHLHINKYEIPGLVPGLLGAAIVLWPAQGDGRQADLAPLADHAGVLRQVAVEAQHRAVHGDEGDIVHHGMRREAQPLVERQGSGDVRNAERNGGEAGFHRGPLVLICES